MAKIKYRLGLDLGTNSLGWCVYRLDEQDEPVSIVRMGARIFADGRDPKTLASRAADRRLARQARRRRDRVLKRRHRVLQGLVEHGLMPADQQARKELQAVDPYELRAKGLDHPLTLHELGRALYHLCRKRGFRSSRKDSATAENEKETGKVKEAIQRLRDQIESEGCRTAGEYLARQHAQRRPVRARRNDSGQYVLYLQRDMVAEEFDKLWESQRRFHPSTLTVDAYRHLCDALLFQRKLVPVMPGRCLFESSEYRAPLCSPLQQRFRILQELNNLRLLEGTDQRPLTLEERNILLGLLLEHPKQTFAKLRAAIGYGRSSNARFNLEMDGKRKELKGDLVGSQFSVGGCIGAAWSHWPPALQEGFALLVARADRTDELINALGMLPDNVEPAREIARPHPHEVQWLEALAQLPARLTAEQCRAIARARLPDDYGSLSHKALARIVPELEREVITYDIAVQRAGYAHHSNLYTGEFFQRLPYYGEVLKGYTSPADKSKVEDEKRFGKIPNPTVHIGLNQLRQLINALIRRYGHPHEIVIELAREFGLSGEKRREILKQQAENQERNERFDAELRQLGVRCNRENRQRLQLWEELGREDALDRYCVYSGARLSKALLFSDEVEIDHILPFSRSLHDGIGNKILCTRASNRDKRNRTPFEAWGHTAQWEEIQARAERLPVHKRKLFLEQAMEVFLGEGDFLARHITDTAYLSRAAKQYLSYICPPNKVWVSSGRLTGLLRGKWGLNVLLSEDSRKNRNDHRHHALDAAVIGLCSRSLIKRMADAARVAEEKGEHRLLEKLDLPWPSYRHELEQTLGKVIVSHRPDHGREAALHNETNYGWRAGPEKKGGNPLVGRRQSLDSIKNAKAAETIADPVLRKEITDLLALLKPGKEVKAALLAYSQRTGVRNVICEQRLAVIPIRDRRTGKPYRYVKGDGNYCYEIFRKPDGRWDGEIISNFEANQRAYKESPSHAQNGLPLVMRIHRDDILAVEHEGGTRYMRVGYISQGIIAMAPPNEANVDARTRDRGGDLKYFFKSPSALKPLRARIVGVDILGYINDPGYRE